MQRTHLILAGLLTGNLAGADNVENVDGMLCASNQVMMCFETGQCFSVQAWELGVPEFVVIDRKKKMISTTKSSGENRSTPIATVSAADGVIYMQGFERGRAFSIVIHQDMGMLTAAVARDGVAVTVFGSCTDADT